MKKCFSEKGATVVSRFILLSTNITLFLFGVLLFSYGVASKVEPEKFSDFVSRLPLETNEKIKLGDLFLSTADFQLILGAFLILICFPGCFGSCCEIRWMLLVYWVIVLVILILELVLLIFIVTYPDKFDKQLHHFQEHSWEVYIPERLKKDGNVIVPSQGNPLYWFGLHTDFACCGVMSHKDCDDLAHWNRTYVVKNVTFDAKVVPSCCMNSHYENITDVDGLIACMTMKKDTYHKRGCFEAVTKGYREYIYIPILAAIFIILIEVVSIAAAIHLWKLAKPEHTPI